ncbi:MAG: hypothetical protein V1664_02620 [Candidatus Uhrbacteria bacterium]
MPATKQDLQNFLTSEAINLVTGSFLGAGFNISEEDVAQIRNKISQKGIGSLIDKSSLGTIGKKTAVIGITLTVRNFVSEDLGGVVSGFLSGSTEQKGTRLASNLKGAAISSSLSGLVTVGDLKRLYQTKSLKKFVSGMDLRRLAVKGAVLGTSALLGAGTGGLGFLALPALQIAGNAAMRFLPEMTIGQAAEKISNVSAADVKNRLLNFREAINKKNLEAKRLKNPQPSRTPKPTVNNQSSPPVPPDPVPQPVVEQKNPLPKPQLPPAKSVRKKPLAWLPSKDKKNNKDSSDEADKKSHLQQNQFQAKHGFPRLPVSPAIPLYPNGVPEPENEDEEETEEGEGTEDERTGKNDNNEENKKESSEKNDEKVDSEPNQQTDEATSVTQRSQQLSQNQQQERQRQKQNPVNDIASEKTKGASQKLRKKSMTYIRRGVEELAQSIGNAFDIGTVGVSTVVTVLMYAVTLTDLTMQIFTFYFKNKMFSFLFPELAEWDPLPISTQILPIKMLHALIILVDILVIGTLTIIVSLSILVIFGPAIGLGALLGTVGTSALDAGGVSSIINFFSGFF